MEEFLLSQKYRPHKIEDCILPDRLKNTFLSFIRKGEIPNLLLSGSPGIGKTTVAKALCEELELPFLFINSSEERGIDTLRTKIKNYASTMTFQGKKKVIILDEADYITPDAQAALRGVMEQYTKLCTFILTCNFKAKLIDAIHSRSTVIDFRLQNSEKPLIAAALFKRLEAILKQENIGYDKPVLAKVIEKHFPDYRRTLNEIQMLASDNGKLDASILTKIKDIRNLKDLFGYLKNKEFTEMRKWVVDNSDVDSSVVFRSIYDTMYDYVKPEFIPQLVVLLGKYQYQAAFAADAEINMAALLTEIMVDVEFK